jgi:hypothetical protein
MHMFSWCQEMYLGCFLYSLAVQVHGNSSNCSKFGPKGPFLWKNTQGRVTIHKPFARTMYDTYSQWMLKNGLGHHYRPYLTCFRSLVLWGAVYVHWQHILSQIWSVSQEWGANGVRMGCEWCEWGANGVRMGCEWGANGVRMAPFARFEKH